MYVNVRMESEEAHMRGVLEKKGELNVGDLKTVGKCGRFWEKGSQIPSSFSCQKEPVMGTKYAKFFFAKKGHVETFFIEELLRKRR